MTVEQLYEQTIRPLPAAQRMRLAAMILNDIPPQSVIDFRTDWSDEDLHDATRHSLERAASSLDEEPDHA